MGYLEDQAMVVVKVFIVGITCMIWNGGLEGLKHGEVVRYTHKLLILLGGLVEGGRSL